MDGVISQISNLSFGNDRGGMEVNSTSSLSERISIVVERILSWMAAAISCWGGRVSYIPSWDVPSQETSTVLNTEILIAASEEDNHRDACLSILLAVHNAPSLKKELINANSTLLGGLESLAKYADLSETRDQIDLEENPEFAFENISVDLSKTRDQIGLEENSGRAFEKIFLEHQENPYRLISGRSNVQILGKTYYMSLSGSSKNIASTIRTNLKEAKQALQAEPGNTKLMNTIRANRDEPIEMETAPPDLTLPNSIVVSLYERCNFEEDNSSHMVQTDLSFKNERYTLTSSVLRLDRASGSQKYVTLQRKCDGWYLLDQEKVSSIDVSDAQLLLKEQGCLFFYEKENVDLP